MMNFLIPVTTKLLLPDCRGNAFQCDNGICIHPSFKRCDGSPQCDDYSDEIGCPGEIHADYSDEQGERLKGCLVQI